MLADAPGVDTWLTANLAKTSSHAIREDWQRTSAAIGSPAPLSEAIYDIRQLLRDQLASWVDELCTEYRLHGPDRHTTQADAGYLHTWLDRIETTAWVADLFDELAETMTQAHALAPWRAELRRCLGIPCPSCGEIQLVIFGGEDVVTCLSCRAIIGSDRYLIWTRIAADEWSDHDHDHGRSRRADRRVGCDHPPLGGRRAA